MMATLGHGCFHSHSIFKVFEIIQKQTLQQRCVDQHLSLATAGQKLAGHLPLRSAHGSSADSHPHNASFASLHSCCESR